MIVDVHTHVFPPRMIAARTELAAADPGFAALYADPAARMASAEDLLASMAKAGVDVAVAAGFAWRSAAHAEEHAAYILDAAARASGRLLAFPPLPALPARGGHADPDDLGGDVDIDEASADPPDDRALRERLRELVEAGARGVGELRLDATALPLTDDAAAKLAQPLLHAARAERLALLVHCTEPVGRDYAGKAGGLTPGALWRLLASEPSNPVPGSPVPTIPASSSPVPTIPASSSPVLTIPALSSPEPSNPTPTDPAPSSPASSSREPTAGVPTSGEPSEHKPAAVLIAAHWGGGLALYAAMPEVRALLQDGALAIDTAATRYLYEPQIIETALALDVGGAVLWGSDFPLQPQSEDRREIERSIADPGARAAVLGGNAARLLGL